MEEHELKELFPLFRLGHVMAKSSVSTTRDVDCTASEQYGAIQLLKKCSNYAMSCQHKILIHDKILESKG